MKTISADKLHSLFSYDKVFGKLYWRPRDRSEFGSKMKFVAWTNKNSGKEAGTVVRDKKTGLARGIRVRIGGRCHAAHKLIWLMFVGPIPDGALIDHENCNPLDNRVENLRIASRPQNAANSISRCNSTGFKCVSKKGKRYAASIRHNGIRIHIGTFDTPEEASAAYYERARILFGTFARQ